MFISVTRQPLADRIQATCVTLWQLQIIIMLMVSTWGMSPVPHEKGQALEEVDNATLGQEDGKKIEIGKTHIYTRSLKRVQAQANTTLSHKPHAHGQIKAKSYPIT